MKKSKPIAREKWRLLRFCRGIYYIVCCLLNDFVSVQVFVNQYSIRQYQKKSKKITFFCNIFEEIATNRVNELQKTKK